ACLVGRCSGQTYPTPPCHRALVGRAGRGSGQLVGGTAEPETFVVPPSQTFCIGLRTNWTIGQLDPIDWTDRPTNFSGRQQGSSGAAELAYSHVFKEREQQVYNPTRGRGAK
ncbi:unnamed protein product, partial [Ectocarpus sp. 8 AP-2014]